MIVYKVPGKNHGPDGKTYDWLGIDEKELKAKLKEGWFESLDEAVNGDEVKLVRARNDDGKYVGDDPSTPDINEAYEFVPTRDEMESKATELGIKFHKNIADKKLVKLIEKELAKG